MRASLMTERQSLSNGRRTPRGTIGPARRGHILAMEAPRRGPYSKAVPQSVVAVSEADDAAPATTAAAVDGARQ